MKAAPSVETPAGADALTLGSAERTEEPLKGALASAGHSVPTCALKTRPPPTPGADVHCAVVSSSTIEQLVAL